MSHESNSPRAIRFLFENSIFLIAGTIAALVWANVDSASYNRFVHFDLKAFVAGDDDEHHGDEHAAAAHGDDEAGHAERQDAAASDAEAEMSSEADEAVAAAGVDHAGDAHPADDHEANDHAEAHGAGHHGLTVHFLVNDILMALFFAIAGKEVFESMLPGGALSNPKRAATPLMATLGGIVGPAGLYIAGAMILGQSGALGRGWAIPCATDIAFSYLVARIVFGSGHPAIAFLLLLAIADDAAGLVILAVFYPSKPLEPAWFLLTAAAIGTGFLFHRVLRLHSFWWYLLIPGVMSWFSFQMAGVHAALGLVPIIPCLPHAHTDLGIFAQKELDRHDTLNEFEHWWKNPVEVVLGVFGLVNAGVVLSSVASGTWLVLLGLLVGKPLGITLFTFIAEKVLRLQVPAGMSYRHVLTLGMIAGIGFTVALFVSTAAFTTPGPIQDSVKMGALLSFGAAPLAILLAKLLRIKPTGSDANEEPEAAVEA